MHKAFYWTFLFLENWLITKRINVFEYIYIYKQKLRNVTINYHNLHITLLFHNHIQSYLHQKKKKYLRCLALKITIWKGRKKFFSSRFTVISSWKIHIKRRCIHHKRMYAIIFVMILITWFVHNVPSKNVLPFILITFLHGNVCRKWMTYKDGKTQKVTFSFMQHFAENAYLSNSMQVYPTCALTRYLE